MRNKAIQVYICLAPLHISILKDLQTECSFIYWEGSYCDIQINDNFPERQSIIQACMHE